MYSTYIWYIAFSKLSGHILQVQSRVHMHSATVVCAYNVCTYSMYGSLLCTEWAQTMHARST